MIRAIIALLAVLFGLAFHSRNHAPVTVDLYAVSVTAPLSWVLVAAVAGGALAGAVAMLPGTWLKQRALRREARQARLQVAALTTTPPASPPRQGDAPGER